MAAMFWTAFLAAIAVNALAVVTIYAVHNYRREGSIWGTAARIVSGVAQVGIGAYTVIVGFAALIMLASFTWYSIERMFY